MGARQSQTGRSGGKWRLGALALSLALVLAPGLSLAADLTINDGATHDLTEYGPPPYNFGNMTIGVNNSFLTATGLTQSADTCTASGSLILGQTSTGSGTYSLSATGSLSAGAEYIGQSGTGAFTQSGGTNAAISILYLGQSSGGSGTYTLSGGSLWAGEYIGASGTGVFTQTGGTHTVSSGLILGRNSGSSGSYDLQGGSLSVASFEIIGYNGSGSFTQNGGTHEVFNLLSGPNPLYLGYNAGASGSYNLSEGSLWTSKESIGLSGTGSFTQSGGTNMLTGGGFGVTYLSLGENAGASGTYELSAAGSLSVSGLECVGKSGSGTFVQSGGTHTTLELNLGQNAGASGSFSLSGGSLQVANDEIIGYRGSGTFTQSGGTNTVDWSFSLGYYAGASGTFNLSGGILEVANNATMGSDGSGTFNQTGGTLAVDADLTVGMNYSPLSASSGTFNLGGTGVLAVSGDEYLGDSGATGTFNQTGGSHTVAGSEYIGCGSSGVFNQSGGTHTAGLLKVSDGAGTGAYNLSGGSLSAGTVELNPGGLFNQTGGTLGFTTFNQNGGTGVFADLYVGRDSGSSGTYNLNGGSLAADYEYLGFGGSGVFTQSGGTHACGELYLGMDSGASGTYTLANGSLETYSQSIGYDGNGAFTQNGGTNTAYVLAVGENAGASGTYTLNSGSFATGYAFIGYDGSGTFTQNGGTHTVDDGFGRGEIDVGMTSGASGSYTLNSGSLSASYEIIGVAGTGTFTQSGGTHTLQTQCGISGLALGADPGGSGTYNQRGGSLSANMEFIAVDGAAPLTTPAAPIPCPKISMWAITRAAALTI